MAAVRRTLAHDDPETGKAYRLNERTATLMVRPRGLHLPEKHVLVDGRPIPGALLDFGLYFFHNAAELLRHGSAVVDAAIVHDHHAIGASHGGEAVGDHEHRPSGHEGGEGLLDEELALGVELGRGLVENENGRIAEKDPRDGDPLALAAG